MAPRHPPESPDDDVQSEAQQAVHDALSDTSLINDPAEAQPATETQQDARPAGAPDETEVEIDRIEAYLRGPTAFTA